MRKQKNQKMKKMLKTNDIAKMFGVNVVTVRRWCMNGLFPNAKREEADRGPVWYIPESDLNSLERRPRGRPSNIKTKERRKVKRER